MKKLTDLNKDFSKLDIEKLLGNEMGNIKGGMLAKAACWSCKPGCKSGCTPGLQYGTPVPTPR